MPVGTGMPASLWLDEFGLLVYHAFGEYPYLVGSALEGKTWRDVDVRVILGDEEWERMEFGKPDERNPKWVSLCLAYATLGQKMTGLPIDFQIQQQSYANEHNKGCGRSALGIMSIGQKMIWQYQERTAKGEDYDRARKENDKAPG
jgi:hypothetical protein